jgi:hypothetical protein
MGYGAGVFLWGGESGNCGLVNECSSLDVQCPTPLCFKRRYVMDRSILCGLDLVLSYQNALSLIKLAHLQTGQVQLLKAVTEGV